MQYFYIELKVRNGEYEYNCSSVHEVLNNKIEVSDFGENHARNFYDNRTGEDEGKYEFNGGEVIVQLYKSHKITKSEYNVMKKYL